jgi:hypothetical protein
METGMKKSLVFSLVGVAVVCCVVGFFCGCETGGDTYFLTVSPSAHSASNKIDVVTFTVGGSTNTTTESGLRPLSLPLKWTVSNANLGYISESSGYSASYVRNTSPGVNTIHVEDQYGAKGHATVNQQ